MVITADQVRELRKDMATTIWSLFLVGGILVLDIVGVPVVADVMLSITMIGLIMRMLRIDDAIEQNTLEDKS